MRTSWPLVLFVSVPASVAQQCLLTYHAPPASAFSGGSMIYHAGLQQAVVVDTNGSSQTRIWAWDGSAWSIIATGGPGRREYAAVAYDSARDRLVLFGGEINMSTYLSDTWEWDRSSWTQRATVGPSPRSTHGRPSEGSRRRTGLVAGYHKPPATTFGDTWEWDGQMWAQVAAAGPGPTQARGSLAYDSVRGRTLLYKSYPSQFWEWDGVQWTQNAGVIPAGSSWMVYDRSRSRAVIGGQGIWDFEPVSGQSTLRQPGSAFGGLAAFDAARSLAVIDADQQTLEYNGAASAVSASQSRASASSLKTCTSASTKSCDTQALQVSHWSSVRMAMRRKSCACWRENLISSQATSSVKPTISRRSMSRSTCPSNWTLKFTSSSNSL